MPASPGGMHLPGLVAALRRRKFVDRKTTAHLEFLAATGNSCPAIENQLRLIVYASHTRRDVRPFGPD